LQFCNINGFVAISDETLLFCLPLNDLILSRVGVVRQGSGLTALDLVNA